MVNCKMEIAVMAPETQEIENAPEMSVIPILKFA